MLMFADVEILKLVLGLGLDDQARTETVHRTVVKNAELKKHRVDCPKNKNCAQKRWNPNTFFQH